MSLLGASYSNDTHDTSAGNVGVPSIEYFSFTPWNYSQTWEQRLARIGWDRTESAAKSLCGAHGITGCVLSTSVYTPVTPVTTDHCPLTTDLYCPTDHGILAL